MTDQPLITCPACGAVSYNVNDIREGYCGRCHDWTGQPRSEIAEIVTASRAAQGLPPSIEDVGILTTIATLMTPGHQVTEDSEEMDGTDGLGKTDH